MRVDGDLKMKNIEHGTILLDDAPSDKDELGGAHERVADAITELIRSGKGGKIIGLEGNWGSGKSTIIRQIRKKLRATNPQPQDDISEDSQPAVEADQPYAVVVFDAWAHEGDPLRRTVLALLEKTLEPWLPSKNLKGWRDWRESLGKKRTSSNVKTRPILNVWDKLLVFALAFWPVGLPMLSRG